MRKGQKTDGDRELNGCIVGVESQSCCCAPQWPALPSSSIIAFLGTHIAVTSGSIAQLNVFSFPLLKGLCRAKPSWAGVTHNQTHTATRPLAPLQLPDLIQHWSQGTDTAHAGCGSRNDGWAEKQRQTEGEKGRKGQTWIWADSVYILSAVMTGQSVI